MRLGQLAAFLPEGRLVGSADVEVRGLAYDSRQVRPGDLFVCRKGLRDDGHRYVPDALRRGAVALVVERPVAASGVPSVLVADGRQALGRLAAGFYGHPSRRLRLIGVTGTNGKTTTTLLIRTALQAAGRRAGLIGTIQHIVGGEATVASRTTPEALEIQEMLWRMQQAGESYAVMEVSSHAVALSRIVGCEFDVGVFTNVTQDHLDLHRTFEEYLAAKTAFLAGIGREAHKQGKAVVLNADDPRAASIARACQVPVVWYGLDAPAEIRAERVRVAPEGISFVARLGEAPVPVRLRLTGRYNVSNALAALAVAVQEGIDPHAAAAALGEMAGVPGRLERVDRGQPFAVLVDYAHTPDSLENVLQAVRGFTSGRVLVAFGCGGDRDRGKRPLMGEVAGRLADYVIVTSDNPRSEEPQAICRQVEEGVRRAGKGPGAYEVVVDRREAIRRAIRLAGPGDAVLIAGKGHEAYQIFRERTVPFDDREEAARALEELLSDGVAAG